MNPLEPCRRRAIVAAQAESAKAKAPEAAQTAPASKSTRKRIPGKLKLAGASNG